MLRFWIITFYVFTILFGAPNNGLLASGNQKTKEKVDSLRALGWDLFYKDPEKVVELANEQLVLSKEINYKEGLYYGFYQKGMAYNELHIFNESVKNSFKALEELETNSLDHFNKRKIKIFKNIGFSYFKTYGFTTANEYYTQALDIALQINDSSEISSLYYNIGATNEQEGNYEQALKNYSVSLEYLTLENRNEFSKIYNSIGNVYSYLKEYHKSNIYYNMALQNSQDEQRTSYYISNLGDNYYDKHIYDSAIYYYQSALTLSQKYNDQEKLNWIKNNLGDTYLSMGDYQSAINLYQQAILTFDENKVDEEYRRSCKRISEAYQNLGEYQKALEYNELFLAQNELVEKTKEKLQEQNSIYRMKEMEWQLERKAKEEQLALSQNIIFIFKLASIALVIVLAIATYQAFRYYKGIRKVKKWLATE